MENKTELVVNAIAHEMHRKKEEAENIIMNAAIEYSKTGNEDCLAEALFKATSLRDSAVNDALNIGEITLSDLNETLTNVDNLIKEYQNSAKDFSENLEMLKKSYGEESDAYSNMKWLSLKVENELYDLYSDRDELISRIKSTEKMMSEI